MLGMKDWMIAVVTVLFGVIVLFVLITVHAFQEVEFRTPLTAGEIDSLAAITAAGMGCNWRYDETGEGEWLRERSVAERRVDGTFQARFMTAMGKYQGLDPDQQCALLDEFPDLVRRWRD